MKFMEFCISVFCLKLLSKMIIFTRKQEPKKNQTKSKIIKKDSRVFSENLRFVRNYHQQWWFPQEKNQKRTKTKSRAF